MEEDLEGLAMGSKNIKQVKFDGKSIPVTVTDENQAVEEWVGGQRGKLFGIDFKWAEDSSAGGWLPNCCKRSGVGKPALLVLCGDGGCLIFQLYRVESALLMTNSFSGSSSCAVWNCVTTTRQNLLMLPDSLSSFLEDSIIKLAGVGIKQSADKLARDQGVACKGLIELQTFASKKLKKPNLKRASVEKLASEVLGMSDVEKPKNPAFFSWSERELYDFQVEYATIDAYLSFAIAQKLLEN